MDYKLMINILGTILAMLLFGFLLVSLLDAGAKVFVAYILGVSVGAIMLSVVFGFFGLNIEETD